MKDSIVKASGDKEKCSQNILSIFIAGFKLKVSARSHIFFSSKKTPPP